MTTIQYFPSLRDYTKRSSISRNKQAKNKADFLYEWVSEDDASDYFDLGRSDGYYRLNYNIISYLLLNHQQLFLNHLTKTELLEFIENENLFYHPNAKVKKFETYMNSKGIDIKTFFKEQLKNILILFNTLSSLPRIPDVITMPRYNKSRENRDKLVLFRGFNYPGCKKMLYDITKGHVITTVTFLSTSIQELIALKYAYNNDDDVRKHIVWKIIIDRDMLEIFNYTFISRPFNINDSLETLLAKSNIECEFLLNMGAMLECVNIRVYPYFPGYNMKGYSIPEKKKGYTEYTFKFIGWNYEYIERINRNMSVYIEYLK
jgi:hypothetical protein